MNNESISVRNGTVSITQNIEVDVELSDILQDVDAEEIAGLYDHRELLEQMPNSSILAHVGASVGAEEIWDGLGDDITNSFANRVRSMDMAEKFTLGDEYSLEGNIVAVSGLLGDRVIVRNASGDKFTVDADQLKPLKTMKHLSYIAHTAVKGVESILLNTTTQDGGGSAEVIGITVQEGNGRRITKLNAMRGTFLTSDEETFLAIVTALTQ